MADSLQPAARLAARPSFVAKAAAVAFPGFGAVAAVEGRIASRVYLGVEGGGFDGPSYGQWFAGMRASYRIPLFSSLSLVPSVGLAHIAARRKDAEHLMLVGQNPVSPTAGVELSYSLGQMIVGVQGEFLPVQLTEDFSNEAARHPGTRRVRALYDVPLGVFAGVTF